jgi:GINS complex subunit 2
MLQSARASDDLENPDKLRSLLKDLREARQAKCRDGLKTLDHSELSVRFSLLLQSRK